MTTQTDIDLIFLLKEENYSIREIAAETGVPKSTVQRILTQSQQPGAGGTEQLRLRVEELENKLESTNAKLEAYIERSHLMLKRFEKAEANKKDAEASEPSSTKLLLGKK
jgi:transcriptional regulator with XRE-family HTH domain